MKIISVVTGVVFVIVLLCLYRRPAVVPVDVGIGIDTSGSARPHLSRYLLQASRFTANLEPGEDLLTLYRVDYETQEFYRDRVRGGREAALTRFLAEVTRLPARSRTLPEVFWREAVKRSENSARPVALLYFSDGDNDDMSAQSNAALRALAARLAANKHVVCVAMIGVNTANSAYWNDCFACLGDRFVISGENDISVDAALERLDKARDAVRQQKQQQK